MAACKAGLKKEMRLSVLQQMQGLKHKPTMLADSVSNMCSFIDMPGLVAASTSAGPGAASTTVPEVQPAPEVQANTNQQADQQEEHAPRGGARGRPSRRKRG